MATSQPSGSAMRKTRIKPAPTHTGSERSINWRGPRPPPNLPARAGRHARPRGRTTSRRIATRLRSEVLHEALANLLVALLQLFRLDGEELQVGELRLVGGVLHVRVPAVESLAVGHHLLDLAAEREVGEEP